MKEVLKFIESALKALTDSKATGPRAESIEAHLKSCASNAKADLADAAAAKPGKEAGFALRGMLALIAVLALFVALLLPRARGDSFNVTNNLLGIKSYTSYPTNPVGERTGQPIDVKNQESAAFFMSCYSDALTNCPFRVQLVRGFGTTPTFWNSTSQDSATGVYWETSPSKTIDFTVTPGVFGYVTNLEAEWLKPANYVGLYLITNNTTITNLNIGVNKKIIPIRYP